MILPILKILIIGGGLAGLTAAYRLQEQGQDVEVYEARNRVGGRILTAMIEGHPAELGAQNINDGGKAENLKKLIGELGLELNEWELSIRSEFSNQINIADSLKEKGIGQEQLWEYLQEIAEHSKNMREVLLRLFDEEDPLFNFFSLRLNGYEGGAVEELSPHYYSTLYYMLLGGLSPTYENDIVKISSVKGGNNKLTEKLAEKLKVHLNHPLAAVARTESGGFALTFRNGKKVEGEVLILSCPCSVYEDIEFAPDVIPQERLSQIQNIKYGTTGKILAYLPTQKRGLFFNERMIAFYDGTNSILTYYYPKGFFTEKTIGEVYLRDSAEIDAQFEREALSLLKPQMALDVPFFSYSSPIAYSWPNDIYAKGSYSYVASGQESIMTELEEVDGESVKSLFSPIDGRLFFAGEHASILLNVAGTMEAACESGERVARMVARLD